ncbi:DUF2267 domain-containing protein [Kitasatospora sp. NPDC088134]|uniref:DUF2267 domain-containing protein n=1 Tax=Kitasatospora sp. NPDC088134 TaxID=3364071 RepID=UPI0037FD9E26
MVLPENTFLATVRERGAYGTSAEAERAARVVLGLLGSHLVGGVRDDLAVRLPAPFDRVLLAPARPVEPLPPERFARAAAVGIGGATERTVLWDVGAVVSAAADAAGTDLMERVLFQLPPGYEVLFGRPDPVRPFGAAGGEPGGEPGP